MLTCVSCCVNLLCVSFVCVCTCVCEGVCARVRMHIYVLAHPCVWWRCSTNPHDKYDCHYNVYAATVAEAEVDVLTGQSQLSRVDMLYDCGERYQNGLVTGF